MKKIRINITSSVHHANEAFSDSIYLRKEFEMTSWGEFESNRTFETDWLAEEREEMAEMENEDVEILRDYSVECEVEEVEC